MPRLCKKVMTNRWGMTIRPGMTVLAAHPRGGLITGSVVKLSTWDAYGNRAALSNGYEIGLDDIFEAYADARTYFRVKLGICARNGDARDGNIMLALMRTPRKYPPRRETMAILGMQPAEVRAIFDR